MTYKKFIAPHIALVIILSVLRLTGIDSIIKNPNPNDDETNIIKYAQATRSIVANYFGEADLNNMYKVSIKEFVNHIQDSTLKITDTPVDTTFPGVKIETISDAFRSFERAYFYVANNTNGENMTKLTEYAIRGLFSTLDPHSTYIEPDDSERVEEEFAGKFQGIGVQFNVLQDTITVITAISGGPSDRLGIRSGDRIIAINDSNAIGFSDDQVRNTLRGEKGSEVDVTILRPGVSELLNFTIVRDDIPLYTVDSSYMLDDQTGYIKINRFAATTHQEFMQASKELRKQGMKRLVLDLRGNPGGYLGQAIAIAEEFFPKGTSLVSTKSKHSRFDGDYFSRKNGEYQGKPVIVLVDEGAASASEIVSGALQDHDRGLIVGKRTFGKGLVQQQYELVDKSNVRVTISRYYTPSGRLIQKPFVEGGGEEYAYEIYRRENATSDAIEFTEAIPDSLKFKTDAGRTVYGGGGIVPDYIIPDDTTRSGYVINFAIRKRAAFEYVRSYLDENGDEFRAEWESDFEKFRTDFEWTPENMEEFKASLIGKGMVITSDVTSPEFRKDSLFIPPSHFEEVAWMSAGRMKAELARQAWNMKAFYPVINDVFDETLKEAMTLWDAVERLASLSQNSNLKSDG